jgi:hypothetical protein
MCVGSPSPPSSVRRLLVTHSAPSSPLMTPTTISSRPSSHAHVSHGHAYIHGLTSSRTTAHSASSASFFPAGGIGSPSLGGMSMGMASPTLSDKIFPSSCVEAAACEAAAAAAAAADSLEPFLQLSGELLLSFIFSLTS